MFTILTDADGIHITFDSEDAALLAAMRSMCVFEVSSQAIAARDVLAGGGSWEAALKAAEAAPLMWGEGRIAPGGGGPWTDADGGIRELGGVAVEVLTKGATCTLRVCKDGWCGAERMALHLRAIVGPDDAAIAEVLARYVAACEERWIERVAAVSGGLPMPSWADARRFAHEDVRTMEAMVAYLNAPEAPLEARVQELEAIASGDDVANLLHHVETMSAAVAKEIAAWEWWCWYWDSRSAACRSAYVRLRRMCDVEDTRRRAVGRAWVQRIVVAKEAAVGRVLADLSRCHAAGLRADQAIDSIEPGARFNDSDRNAAKPRPPDDRARGGVYGVARLGLGISLRTVADYHFRHGSVGGHWWEVCDERGARLV